MAIVTLANKIGRIAWAVLRRAEPYRPVSAQNIDTPAFVRRITLRGHDAREIGLRQDLGYRGGQVLDAFPGCDRRKADG